MLQNEMATIRFLTKARQEKMVESERSTNQALDICYASHLGFHRAIPVKVYHQVLEEAT